MENKDEKEVKEDAGRKYHYFVDTDKFESGEPNTTGALIKVKLPEAKRTYSLYLEGHGKDPDQLINDETSVSLEKRDKRFFTAPPASFGII